MAFARGKKIVEGLELLSPYLSTNIICNLQRNMMAQLLSGPDSGDMAYEVIQSWCSFEISGRLRKYHEQKKSKT